MDQATPANALVLVRYSGDLTTKARPTRQQFSKRLAANVKDALRSRGSDGSGGLRSRIERRHDRMHVALEPGADAHEAARRISRVFGVQSVSRVVERPWSGSDDLVRMGVELMFIPRSPQIPIGLTTVMSYTAEKIPPTPSGLDWSTLLLKLLG